MGKIITICNFKGGTGKSTTTHCLAVGLGQRGYKVLIVDADSQCNLSYISKVDIRNNFNTIYEMMKGEKEPHDVIVSTKYYDIICGSLSTTKADREFQDDQYRFNAYYLLKGQLEKVRGEYDFILIDTPPTLAIMTQNCLIASDSLIVPTQADSLCISGLSNLKNQIDLIKSQTMNKTLYIEGLLLVKFQERTTLNRILRDELFEMAKKLETKVYNFAVRESTGVRESQTMKSNVLIDNPKNISAIDYNLFIDEFLRDNGKEGVKNGN